MTMIKPYVMGIDIGGTNTVFGIVDARGHVVASDSIKTRKHANFDDYIKELHDGAERLIKVLEHLTGQTGLHLAHIVKDQLEVKGEKIGQRR